MSRLGSLRSPEFLETRVNYFLAPRSSLRVSKEERIRLQCPRPMKNVACALLIFFPFAVMAEETTPRFDSAARRTFSAGLALACVGKEYPNKISHLLMRDAEVAPPRKITPAFYGSYDWHSSVHGHWLLARLVKTFPEAPFAKPAREALRKSLTEENLKQEAAYLRGEGRASFERPYGMVWLLQLTVELREWDDPQAREMLGNLRPLEDAVLERLKGWLPKLSHPVRIGEHNQSAFALGLLLDYARATKNEEFGKLVTEKTREFFLRDKDCSLNYEPSGEDFLSPCLGEADAMRRVLAPDDFAKWLGEFLPHLPTTATTGWLPVAVSPDPSDPKLAHLDGLNLSRAWMLDGIVSALPASDARRPALMATAEAHRRAGLGAVTGAHYEGGHWLGTFRCLFCCHPARARAWPDEVAPLVMRRQFPLVRSAGCFSLCSAWPPRAAAAEEKELTALEIFDRTLTAFDNQRAALHDWQYHQTLTTHQFDASGNVTARGTWQSIVRPGDPRALEYVAERMEGKLSFFKSESASYPAPASSTPPRSQNQNRTTSPKKKPGRIGR